jgi:hypothetical protein
MDEHAALKAALRPCMMLVVFCLQNRKVYPETLNNAFVLWRRLQFHLERCQGQERDTCPACADNLHSAHADGNHKLWVQDGRQVNRDSWYKGQKGAIFVDDRQVRTNTACQLSWFLGASSCAALLLISSVARIIQACTAASAQA